MLQGTLDEFPLIDVLGILRARNKTGRLDIERQAGRGLIYVRLGEPYYAESSLTRSLIGQKLVDIGAITEMQLRKALDRQAESGDRLGQILLTHGVISREHIAAAVIAQIKDALSDLLAWETGEFKWEVGAEVEVEVPVFGGMLSDNGSIPLTPHVVPVTPAPNEAPSVAQAVEAQQPAQPEFLRSGTALNDAEPTPQIDESPAFEPQVQPQLEVVHSPTAGGGSTDEESPPVPFVQTAAEPELHTAVENETEQQEDSEAANENPSGDVPGEFDGSESDEPYSSEESTDDESDEDETAVADSSEVASYGDASEDESHEDESVVAEDFSDEGDSHAEDESDEDETAVAEDSSDEDDSEKNESDELESHDDESAVAEDASDEDGSDRDSGDQVEDQPLAEYHPVELPHAEIVESYDGTRVIKSSPAPEFDEEFDHMIAATEELAAEREAQERELMPVEEAVSFEAEPTETAPLDEAPYFEADPVAEASMYETEVSETAPLDEAPAVEVNPVDEVPSFEVEPIDEVPSFETKPTESAPLDEAPSFEPVEHQPATFGFEQVPVLETFEALAAIASEPVAPAPPPPPPMMEAPQAPEAPEAPEALEAPLDEAPVEESDEVEEEAPQEPAQDIKLDRSSLARELSDLLR